MKLSPALTWDDLANDYKRITGGTARTQPMDKIFSWAEKRTDLYYVDPKKQTLHRRLS